MKSIKFLLILIAGFFFVANTAVSQDVKADDVLGVWLNEDKDAHIEVYKQDDLFYGKIIWLKDPIDEETGKPKLDDENPDEALQSRPVLGLLLLKDFEFDEDEWEDGTIYDPKNGNTYSCYMKLLSEDELKIRGYVGITLFGRTTYWTRVKDQ